MCSHHYDKTWHHELLCMHPSQVTTVWMGIALLHVYSLREEYYRYCLIDLLTPATLNARFISDGCLLKPDIPV
ncbi:hypothetical protein BDV40DRAFT_273795 [Aspergillus tamarii]|uniref:Uncharacterized protein n=1 Tax=Aspergillus tamarii TaxID=41984 RepID=A0A5N6UKV7_ASPTM|nr:hypothetical protein BDV40DRAFT_273795 [Aspergillus tamarii]